MSRSVMADTATQGYPELYADLADQVAAKLTDYGVNVEHAAEIGMGVAEHIRAHWSGQDIYFPKGIGYELSRRDVEIFELFNGRNVQALARKYNLSVIRIYQIVKAVRAEMIKKSQASLF